jgi:hypothetical protein
MVKISLLPARAPGQSSRRAEPAGGRGAHDRVTAPLDPTGTGDCGARGQGARPEKHASSRWGDMRAERAPIPIEKADLRKRSSTLEGAAHVLNANWARPVLRKAATALAAPLRSAEANEGGWRR